MRLKNFVTLEGERFWYREDDVCIGQRMAVLKYEPYLTKLLLKQTRAGGKVVDVGANIGHYTIKTAKKVGKTGKIFAFEPEGMCFNLLKKNVEENKLKNVILKKLAAGKNKSKIKIQKSKMNYGDNKVSYQLRVTSYELMKTETIEMVSLDECLGKEKIDLMKIDVQGWEPEVIEGAKRLIKKWKPTIFFEFDKTMMVGAKTDYKKMWEFLKKVYGKIFYVDEWAEVYYSIDKIPNNACNLMVTTRSGWQFWRESLADFKLKKWLKRLFENIKAKLGKVFFKG